MKKLPKLLLLLVFLLILASCKAENPFVGTFSDDNMTITLRVNNTFVISDEDGAIRGTYEIEDGIITLTINETEEENPVNDNIKVGDSIECEIKVQEDVLSVTYGGKVYKFDRE